MTISYKWISEYIPLSIPPDEISKILTSIGLEVESMEAYESIRGGLRGLVVGEVRECIQHPGADKLKLTKVDTGDGQLLQIVCGAPNVAAGQKVIVAKTGATIYPVKGEPVTMKAAKIRGEESFGMICAEDEIGVGESHAGIIVLPPDTKTGAEAASYFKPYTDWIYEIGLTPNRMDAMSHVGVARDVCAYLSHHQQKQIKIKTPVANEITRGGSLPFSVSIENHEACKRYAGVSISGIQVKESPQWLQDKLKSIGLRPINNIVDITNFILHDTGQPLHAFDADKVSKRKIIVKNLEEGTPFTTLDEKERKLSSEDLMICDGDGNGMCIAGIFGGAESGVKEQTKHIFLESAWFNPVDIRKTSFRQGLRTDAATRFEKNVDISNTVQVLKLAAAMIIDVAGGAIASAVIDIYPNPAEKAEVVLQYDYVKKLSGKNYAADTIKGILTNLGFEIKSESTEQLLLRVPFSKSDVSMQADVIEEIMRIDGYDNISIPSSITITPANGVINAELVRKEKIANYLVGAGFSEIFTNSITNAAYFENGELENAVRLLNNLSAVHNIMRPSMLETGLESVAYNLNRKNNHLRFLEFGKIYVKTSDTSYVEEERLCLYVTGSKTPANWKGKAEAADIYFIKGMAEAVLSLLGLPEMNWETLKSGKLSDALMVKIGDETAAQAGSVGRHELARFDIRQDVFYAEINWQLVARKSAARKLSYQPLANQLPVFRDLAMVVPAALQYQQVETAVKKIKLGKLQSMQLFDVFESEKLGAGKKSFAISFSFLDNEKTLTDKEIDGMMTKIMRTLEQDLSAEIRKGA